MRRNLLLLIALSLGTSVGAVPTAAEVGLEVVWKRPLGSGYSGIAVADGRAVTMFSDGRFDYVIALEAETGEERWRFRLGTTYSGRGGSENGPSSTPVVDGGVVFGLAPKGLLFAITLADGNPVWTRKIDEDFQLTIPLFGMVTTPLVEDDVLIVQTGNPDEGAISGFDKQTGKTLWSVGSDTVGYQSPKVMTLAGQRQVIAVGDTTVMGILPRSGEILWTHEYGEGGSPGCARPVQVAANRFLLSPSSSGYGWQTTGVLYELRQEDAGVRLEEVWQSDSIKNSYALPAFHDGHFYTFKGNFLACVDAGSGEEVWVSRPPGGQALTLSVNGLTILSSQGDLVMVRPTPDGYREWARASILDNGSYTAPSVVGDRIFVRNHIEIAAVAMTESVTTVPAVDKDAIIPAGEFANFVRKVRAATDKTALIDEWMNSHETFPIVENNNTVHFIYRGDVEDVAILGSMTDLSDPEPLTNIEGTDFHYRSYTFEPDTRWEYFFDVDFGQITTDPLNPRTYVSEWGEISEIWMPEWAHPADVNEPIGNRGRIETFNLESEILGEQREVRAYLPPGWSRDQRYPLLIVSNGPAALELGKMDHSLDNLIGDGVAPTVVAFVTPLPYPARYSEFLGEGASTYAQMLAEELVPFFEKNYGTIPQPDARALMGTFESAQATVHTAMLYPQVFGKVAVQSVRLQPPIRDHIFARLSDAKELPVEFYVDWNGSDWRNPVYDLDLRRDSSTMFDMLKERGQVLTGGEFPGGAGWGSWRARNKLILETLFPAPR